MTHTVGKIKLTKEDIHEGHIFNWELTGKTLICLYDLIKQCPPNKKYGDLVELGDQIGEVVDNLESYVSLDVIKESDKADIKKKKHISNNEKLEGLKTELESFRQIRNIPP